MFRTFAAGCLLATFTSAAWGNDGSYNTQYQLTCEGRPTMTVTKARYGLTTLKWPDAHFQVAAGRQLTHTENGDNIAIVLFRNGDRLLVNKSTHTTFFSFDGDTALVPCSRSSERENSAVQLPRTDASGKLES